MGQATIKNDSGLGITMAVWLAADGYNSGADVAPAGELISATTLLKPTRQFILSQQVPVTEDSIPDVTDRIAARLGHAIHNDIEETWRNKYREAMTALGMAKGMIDSIRINPEEVEEGTIPVYLEQRGFKEHNGVVVTGQFDEVINGELGDTKSTSVFAYLNNTNEKKYRLQGSIYRWINPELITSDIFTIRHVFTDWQRMMLKQNPKYPAHRVIDVKYELLPILETESWINAKLAEIRRNIMLPQSEMIRCTEEELWRSAPQFKYYSDPAKAKLGGRSTKNFSTKQEAMTHVQKSGKGTVVDVPGKVKACAYCPAFSICDQAQEYSHD